MINLDNAAAARLGDALAHLMKFCRERESGRVITPAGAYRADTLGFVIVNLVRDAIEPPTEAPAEPPPLRQEGPWQAVGVLRDAAGCPWTLWHRSAWRDDPLFAGYTATRGVPDYADVPHPDVGAYSTPSSLYRIKGLTEVSR